MLDLICIPCSTVNALVKSGIILGFVPVAGTCWYTSRFTTAAEVTLGLYPNIYAKVYRLFFCFAYCKKLSCI